MHYIPRNVSVRSHQVNHCVKSFDILIEKQSVSVFKRGVSSSNFSLRSLQMSDDFYKSSFFLNYLTLLYDDEQLQ